MKRRSEEERRKILTGLLGGQYMVLDTKEKISIGAGLVLGLNTNKIPKEDFAEMGAILGDLTKTIGARTCNGIPLFSIILLIQKEDWTLIATAYNKEMERLKSIKV